MCGSGGLVQISCRVVGEMNSTAVLKLEVVKNGTPNTYGDKDTGARARLQPEIQRDVTVQLLIFKSLEVWVGDLF